MEVFIIMNQELYLDIASKLAKKWDFLVEDIGDDYVRSTTAVLLENTNRKIAEDSSSLISEGFETADITGINRIMLPIIRRVYPHLMANEFVTVQPMLTPVAQIFYLRYRYGATGTNLSGQSATPSKGGVNANDEFLRVPAYGNFGVNPYYSSQTVGPETIVATVNGDSVTTVTQATFTDWKNWGPATLVTLQLKDKTTGQVVEEYTLPVDGTAATRRRGTTEMLKLSTATAGGTGDTASSYTLSVTANVNYASGVDTATYSVIAFVDYKQEGTKLIPEMKISIETESVTAKERKLKTEFTQEALQDLKALHNIDAEAEITSVISSMLIAEIDREIISDLLDGAAIRLSHDYNSVGTVNFLDKNQALAQKVVEAAALIHKYGKLGSGNWAITNPVIAAKLETVRGFESANSGKFEEFALGINMVGTMNGRQIKIYVDPYFPQGKILVGYKGNSFLSTAFVYAPYQPLYSTPLIYDPATLKPIRGFLTRYGKKLVIGGEYLLACVNVTGADSLGSGTW
jgi:hypothetical protein